MIPLELRTEIRRLYYGEHWKVGTIASNLHVHHETVRSAIASETLGARRGVCRPTALDPYLPFIRDTLAQYPRLRATRLHEMLRGRGYAGAATQVSAADSTSVTKLNGRRLHAVGRLVSLGNGEQERKAPFISPTRGPRSHREPASTPLWPMLGGRAA